MQDFIPFAHRLADAAGAVIRRHFRTSVAVDTKADLSPVTIADREAEAAMRSLILETYPDHGILGEEQGSHHLEARHVWVLDPIDGTKSFITGRPQFGILIALVEEGRPILGIIDQPILGERWVGAAGTATTFNGRPVQVRACAEVAAATLFATTPHMFVAEDFTAFERVRKAARMTLYGSDCYAYGLLASGFCDLVVEASLQPYDYCALVPVIAGAGGMITDWNGQPLTMSAGGRVVAAGDKAAHGQALALLEGTSC